MHIPTLLKIHGKDIHSEALIDSRVEGTFINKKLVKQLNLSLIPLTQPILAKNIDGTPIIGSTITHKVTIPLKTETKAIGTELLVTPIGQKQLILGLSWLK